MAAFLTVDNLRAPVWRAVQPIAHDRAGERARPRPVPRSCPVLAARWLVAPGGRLICRWQTEIFAPFGPPPD